MNKKVLVVDDDKEICELVELFLKLERYAMITANTGMGGIDIDVFRKNNISLVVLDIGCQMFHYLK